MSDNNCTHVTFDAYSPKEMACKAQTVGVAKAKLGFLSTLMLGILAGAFIGLGAAFFTTVVTGAPTGFGITRLIGGVVFCLGLILVVVAGAELFTGNTLIVMAFVSRKISFLQLVRNWAIVYLGNLIGSLVTVFLVYSAWQWKMSDMGVGVTAYNIAGAKLNIPFMVAIASGTMCNALVCMAVWLCYSARTTTDKILSIIFPISAFVAMGFEHSVANMFFVPYGLILAKSGEFLSNPAAAEAIHRFDPSIYTASNFLLNNLLPVTIGNIIGGCIMVGLAYWVIYLRPESRGPVADGVVAVPSEESVEQLSK